MATFAENSLKEFNATLDDLAGSLQFLKASSRLRPRLGNLLNWDTVGELDAKVLVDNYIKSKNVEPTAFYRGFLIVLAGAFEYLVRRLLAETILSINQAVVNFDELLPKVKIQNTIRTAEALRTISEPLDHLNFDFEELAVNLATCRSGATSFALNAEAFAIRITNVGPIHLFEIFERAGIKLTWDDFGKDPTLQALFEQKSTRPTSIAIEGFLDRFIKTRNRLAHTGSGGIIVTEDEIEVLLRFFGIFSTILARVVHSKLPKKRSGKS
jgi:hypothetical protein